MVGDLLVLRGFTTMTKTRVLFICATNSARSQMAEAFLKHSREIVTTRSAQGWGQASYTPWRYWSWRKRGLV